MSKAITYLLVAIITVAGFIMNTLGVILSKTWIMILGLFMAFVAGFILRDSKG